jgi:predicted dienelactone hydrolase
MAQAPPPTGLYHVGTREFYLTDAARRDPFLANGSARELVIRFWYPASTTPGCRIAPYTSQLVWSYLAQLTALSLPPVRTNSCQDAQILRGPHPVVIFSHGYTGMFTDATYLFEDLASRGYVIASIAHIYESTAVELNGGRVGKSAFGSYLAPASMRSDLDSLTRAFSIRLADLKFVVNELERFNTASNSPFEGNLDLTRVAVMGHSLGGVTALAGLEQQSGIAAAVAIDPIFPSAPLRATTRPVLILAAGRERWSRQECILWSRLHGPRLAVNLKGADHFTPSDNSWLLGQIGLEQQADITQSVKSVATIREYIAAFLDANLLGRPPRLLLKHPSPDLMDLAMTTSTQNLCSDSAAD